MSTHPKAEVAKELKEVVSRASGDISILLGAGASAAAGLPAMYSFLEEALGKDFLKDISGGKPYHFGTQDIRQDGQNKSVIVQRLIHTAGLKKGRPAIDLEEIFEFIHKSPVTAHEDSQIHALKAMFWMYQVCHDQHSWPFDEYKKNFRQFLGNFDAWLHNFQSAVNDLRRRMFDSYLIDNDRDQVLSKAASVYSILPKIFTSSPAVVFTTNFDTVFEALKYTGLIDADIYTGMGGHQPQSFDWANFLSPTRSKNPILLFKLHGSVSWEQTKQGIRQCYPQVPAPRKGINSNVALVEPVLSKRRAASPFKEMYEVFEKVLESNRLCIAIGFSFRDDEIRNIISARLTENPTVRLLIVAPEDSSYPELNEHLELLAAYPNVTWIKAYFGQPETERKILSVIEDVVGGWNSMSANERVAVRTLSSRQGS